MAVTELTRLHRTVNELRSAMADVRSRYGDLLDLDPSELDTMPPRPAAEQSVPDARR
jgi:hypothetical protein